MEKVPCYGIFFLPIRDEASYHILTGFEHILQRRMKYIFRNLNNISIWEIITLNKKVFA